MKFRDDLAEGKTDGSSTKKVNSSLGSGLGLRVKLHGKLSGIKDWKEQFMECMK